MNATEKKMIDSIVKRTQLLDAMKLFADTFMGTNPTPYQTLEALEGLILGAKALQDIIKQDIEDGIV